MTPIEDQILVMVDTKDITQFTETQTTSTGILSLTVPVSGPFSIQTDPCPGKAILLPVMKIMQIITRHNMNMVA